METDGIHKAPINSREIWINAMTAYTPSTRFIYISDLHFDCDNRSIPIQKRLNKLKNNDSAPDYEQNDSFEERENCFIQYAKENFAHDILLLAGDYYTNYEKSLSFVQRLEAAQVTGFFVLGNNDFSSENQTGFDEIIGLFLSSTESNEFFKFLITGKQYYHDDICIIGDTGWNLTNRIGPESMRHIPEKTFIKESKKWIKFAKRVLSQEKKVLIISHFPQVEFPKGIKEKYYFDWADAKAWFPQTNCWKIFGHTHQRGRFQFDNNICAQQGYQSPSCSYCMNDFGILEKGVESKPNKAAGALSIFQGLVPFYSAKMVLNPEKELQAIKEIKSRGFRRSGHADNKRAIAALISNKQAYLDAIRKHVASVSFIEFIGYSLADTISPRILDAVNDAVRVLETVNPGNARPFMTALVITGYVYNNMINMLESMRPVDDYDIMRWFLMFATIQKYNIDPNDITSIRKNENAHFFFQNVQIYLPKVNNHSLKVEEVRSLLKKTGLLPDNHFKKSALDN